MGTAKVEEVNYLQKVREDMLISRAELARKAGISSLTVKRIEDGYPSHNQTKRKILSALDIPIADRDKVFPRKEKEASYGVH